VVSTPAGFPLAPQDVPRIRLLGGFVLEVAAAPVALPRSCWRASPTCFPDGTRRGPCSPGSSCGSRGCTRSRRPVAGSPTPDGAPKPHRFTPTECTRWALDRLHKQRCRWAVTTSRSSAPPRRDERGGRLVAPYDPRW